MTRAAASLLFALLQSMLMCINMIMGINLLLIDLP